MADSKVIKVVKSSQLLSNLSTMKDEVRDRTIFVQVSSECHSWSDVEIVALFSEFGRVEEVKLLSTGNHFHSQIRYQTEYDRECACYYYQDGWLVHQNCCEIQVYRADDIVCVNAQRIDNIQAANVISANSKVLNSTGLLEETLMNKEVVSQAEESTQLLPEDSLDFVAHYVLDQMPKKEPNSAHDSSGLAALKVFEEMPGSTVNGELILVDEIANKNEEPPDDILECVICFDPGGSRLIESDHAISLSNMGCEDEVAKAEKSSHIWKNEQVTVKEFSYFADQRMLDEMPKSKKCCEVELSAEFRTSATPWAESAEDILALERQNSTVTVIKAFREVMMVFDMGNLSFDPGGLMAMNAHRSLVAWAEKSFSHCIITAENSIEELKSQSLKINSVSEQKEASIPSSRNGIINLPNHTSAQEDMLELQKVQLTALKCFKKLIAKLKHQLLKFRHQHVFIMAEILGDASIYAQWAASLIIAEIWRTRICRLVFDPGRRECIFASSGIVLQKTYIAVWEEAPNPALASVMYVPEFMFDVLIKFEMFTCVLLCTSVLIVKHLKLWGDAPFLNHGLELLLVLQIKGVPNEGEFVLVAHESHFGINMNAAGNKHEYERAATWSVATLYAQQVVLFGLLLNVGIMQAYGNLEPSPSFNLYAAGHNCPSKRLVGAYTRKNSAEYLCSKFQSMGFCELLKFFGIKDGIVSLWVRSHPNALPSNRPEFPGGESSTRKPSSNCKLVAGVLVNGE